MDPKFGGKPVSSGAHVPGRIDLDHMPDTPTRGPHHRRAQSETFFRFPDLDDMLIDDVMGCVSFDPPQTPPSLLPREPPQVNTTELTKPASHLRSLSVDADFFEGLELDGPGPPLTAESSRRPRHRHSNSMDGYSSATSSEVDFNAKKGMAADRLAELALIDPKRAKRILANRQSAARSKERKTRYTSELEKKVQTLQNEATTLSTQITVLQRDTTGLTAENKELKLKLQAMEQQARLRDALNDALKDELQWLKIAAGHVPGANGNNSRGSAPQFSSQPATLRYFGNHQGQQQPQQMPSSGPNNSSLSRQSQLGFRDFNQRA